MITDIDKTKADKLARKLKRSIKNIQNVLNKTKKNGGNIPTACIDSGLSRNYVSCGMFFLRAAEKKNGVKVPEIARLERAIRAAKRIKKAVTSAKKYSRSKSGRTVQPVAAPVASPMKNVLEHIVEGTVEFKYPVITDRPIAKVVETYPLRALQPGHAFAVPAEKWVIMAAKKAVTQFAKKNPAMRFLQQKEKNEFVTYRTA